LSRALRGKQTKTTFLINIFATGLPGQVILLQCLAMNKYFTESRKDTKERFSNASVHNDAKAQHAVLDIIESEQIVPKSTDEIITTGMSKGSIVGRLAVLYASEYGRRVPYFDGVDSSGEHPWTLKDLDLNKLKQIGRGPVLETIGLVKLASEATPAQLIRMGLHYVADPRSIPGHLAYTRSLVRSEGGNDKGLVIPQDSIMHLTCQEGCWFNQHDAWAKRFEQWQMRMY
jgi:hypothetical protein